MMHRSGKVSANDIEMVIYACKDNEYQFYVPIGKIDTSDGEKKVFGLSKAIRAEYIYRATDTTESTDICTSKNGEIIIGNKYKYNSALQKYELIV